MTNVWELLLQTGTVSLVAVLILTLKEILREHLSPRWQYGIWSLLALRCLIPVNPRRSVILPIGWWVEILKGRIESGLDSAFSGAYLPVDYDHVLPMVTGRPLSITDWLFVIYAVGVAVCALWYGAGYARLRRTLKRGNAVSPETERKICRLSGEYGLAACPCVEVEGISSAFVCGIFRPVLVIPRDAEVDDKVLLHELLHLKYGDALQNFFWCALRCLHWCNPFLLWVFNRIGNDMESLCDQRVLERLEGEQRRDYGRILLSMANERYARAPGTTSVSNGGKNIARRIEAIVRFKRYPKGMGLVSICILLTLMVPTLVGSAADYGRSTWVSLYPQELESAMAMTRLERCDTPLGAVDCWAKGLLMENGIYIAMASPLDQQEAIAAEMQRNADDGWFCNRYDPGWEIDGAFTGSSYEVLDLVKQPDGSYTGFAAFRCFGIYDEEEVIRFLDSQGNCCWGFTLVPIRVYESDGWVVEETGERTIHPGKDIEATGEDVEALLYSDRIIPLRKATVETAAGTLTVSARSYYGCDGHNGGLFSEHYGNTTVLAPDAELTGVQTRFRGTLDCPDAPEGSLKLELYLMPHLDAWYEFPEGSGIGGGHSQGYAFEHGYADTWTGSVIVTGTTEGYKETVKGFGQPMLFRYRISRNGETLEEGTVTVE